MDRNPILTDMSVLKKLLGKNDYIEQPQELSGGPNKPSILTRLFKGPKGKVQALLPQVQLAGWDYSYKENGPNATLAVTTPQLQSGGGADTEAPVNTWEFLPAAH